MMRRPRSTRARGTRVTAETEAQSWSDDGPAVRGLDVEHARGLHITPVAECVACVMDYRMRLEIETEQGHNHDRQG